MNLHTDLRYLYTDVGTQELFKCLDPIDPKIDIYVEDATPIQKQMLVKDVNVVEDVDVNGVDGDGDDNEVDVEDWDEALANDKFEEGGNLVDEGNDARGNNGNGVMEDVDYEWYDSDYDDPANEKLHEIIVDEVDGNTFQPITTHNGQPSQEPTIAIHSLSHPPNFVNQSLSHLYLVPTLFNWSLDEIPSGSNYASLDELHSPDNSNGKQKKKLLEFKLECLKDPEFVFGISFRDNK